MFKCSEWKPALALLITRNALSGCPSKTWVLKTMPSRSHKACELFVLPVQPVCLCSSFRGRAKLSVLKRGRGCVKKKKTGGEKGGGKAVSSGKRFLNSGALVQYCSHAAVARGISGIWTCTREHTSTCTHYCTRAPRAGRVTVWFKRGKLLMARQLSNHREEQ